MSKPRGARRDKRQPAEKPLPLHSLPPSGLRDDVALNLLSFKAWAGEATKDEAKSLLLYFCECAERSAPMPRRLVTHFSEAFTRYLRGECSLERALGLVGRRGAPAESDEELRIQMAAAILERRLAGKTHEEALAEVSSPSSRDTVLGEAWAAHQLDAVMWIERGRRRAKPQGEIWTEAEKEKLTEIFRGKEWFIYSANSPAIAK